MEYHVTNNDAFIRLNPRESLVGSLTQFAKETGLEFATIVSGVGMLDGLEMGWFCVNDNDYDKYRVAGIFDLSSVSGNIALFNGAPRAHVHIIANRGDFGTLSGHLIECRCHITMEIGLRVFEKTGLVRKSVEGRLATMITKLSFRVDYLFDNIHFQSQNEKQEIEIKIKQLDFSNK